ncbi:MAG: DUF2442 domain-containing protein [Rhodoplanes sp.]
MERFNHDVLVPNLERDLAMPRIAAIRVEAPSRLEITWAAGTRAGRKESVDLAPFIGSYKVYKPLRNNSDLFATAHLIEDGNVVAWDAPDLEMSGEMIETLAEEEMTPKEFANFLRRNKLTQEAAAALLGRTRRMIGYYLSNGPIPRVVSLACFGYEALIARRRKEAA